ncbi:MAG: SMC-Scp complex subunit ScpB [Alphaproteobacteria bacterium]|nr:SMC-Scp complex subunit ScpB [Alphaproteobacteria bacterium]
MTDNTQELRILEAVLFAVSEPVTESALAQRFPEGVDVPALLAELAQQYEGRGVVLQPVAGRWAFRTAPDLAGSLEIEVKVSRKLSRAAVETLSIIGYHQPVTRGEIEEIRGVALSRGTLDLLLEIGWIRPVGKRKTPGRPVTWGTSQEFLDHFNLNKLSDLPGVGELKAAGLLDPRPARTIFGEVAAKIDEPNASSAVDEEEGAVPEPLNTDDDAAPAEQQDA